MSAVIIISDMVQKSLIFVLGISAFLIGPVISDCEIAEPCDRAACDELGSENCHCSGDETNFQLSDRPMVSGFLLHSYITTNPRLSI